VRTGRVARLPLAKYSRRSSQAASLLAIAACGVIVGEASAQVSVRSARPGWVGSFADSDRRLAQLSGAEPLASLMIRPLATVERGADSGMSIEALYPAARVRYNRNVPYGMNDGVLWAGRGLSTSVDLGIEFHWANVTLRAAPTITWSQNQAFTLATQAFPPPNPTPFGDQWWSGRIDRPQRHGDGSFSRIDAGQTVARVDWRGVTAGAGTESMWWGPGIDNSILMTNNGPGFPHAFVGTRRPVNVYIGRLEAMYLAGRLYDSGFWRSGGQPNRNRRWIGALVAVLEPRGAPGLYLGGGRVFYEYIPADGLGLGDFVGILQPFQKKSFSTPSNPSGNDTADQMIALFGRWVFPEVGFEVYGEWGRNDHAWDARDFVLEPDHASAMILGFQKVFGEFGRQLVVRGELTALAEGRTAELRPAPPWYANHVVLQGYTQRGQVIGAGIGPGSDMQRLAGEWRDHNWNVGLFTERWRNDSDGFYRFYSPGGLIPGTFRNHDVLMSVGATGGIDRPRGRLQATLQHGIQRNRYAIRGNDVGNVHVDITAELRLP
jgi:hypothetical protein